MQKEVDNIEVDVDCSKDVLIGREVMHHEGSIKEDVATENERAKERVHKVQDGGELSVEAKH